MTDWEPTELEQLRFWAEKMEWNSDELPYNSDFRFRAWRRDGERLTVIWREHEWTPAETWFETPDVEGRMESLLLSDICTGLRWWEPTYDFVGLPDIAVAKMLQGKTITWRNALNKRADDTEKETLPPKYEQLRISRGHRMRRPWVTFSNGAFRSVFLDAITEIK